jgi:CheY-like chemotaxis protein
MKPIHILLVEDNEGDILLTREALEEARMLSSLSVVHDGKAAVDFLSEASKREDKILPDLVLLDVNLPKKNGHEVLKFIKTDLVLKHIPVIMLTTSSSEKDINLAYNNYVNCYITKPVDADDFLNVVAAIKNYWVSIAKLPTN